MFSAKHQTTTMMMWMIESVKNINAISTAEGVSLPFRHWFHPIETIRAMIRAKHLISSHPMVRLSTSPTHTTSIASRSKQRGMIMRRNLQLFQITFTQHIQFTHHSSCTYLYIIHISSLSTTTLPSKRANKMVCTSSSRHAYVIYALDQYTCQPN